MDQYFWWHGSDLRVTRGKGRLLVTMHITGSLHPTRRWRGEQPQFYDMICNFQVWKLSENWILRNPSCRYQFDLPANYSMPLESGWHQLTPTYLLCYCYNITKTRFLNERYCINSLLLHKESSDFKIFLYWVCVTIKFNFLSPSSHISYGYRILPALLN